MNEESRAYFELHIAVFLYGLTAILGDLILMNAIAIVWWRLFLTVISLIFIMKYMHKDGFKKWKSLPRKTQLQLAGVGCLVGLHWVLFYGAIKLSNASITLVCLATSTFFIAFLEPWIMKRPLRWYEILLGLVVIPGMFLVVDGIDESLYMGVPVALGAAFVGALFATLNKKMVTSAHPITITSIELSAALVLLTVMLPFSVTDFNWIELWPSGLDWIYLLVLALLCTTLAFILNIRALNHLTAFMSSLAINLEPVYGIILAFFVLNDADEMTPKFYYGVLIIILAVFSYPVVRRIMRRRREKASRIENASG